MPCARWLVVIVTAFLPTVGLLVSRAEAELPLSGGSYSVSPVSVNNGGERATGSSGGISYTIEGTVGQAHALGQASNGPFRVQAGYGFGTLGAPEVTGWQSVLTHGLAGTFALDLVAGGTNREPRRPRTYPSDQYRFIAYFDIARMRAADGNIGPNDVDVLDGAETPHVPTNVRFPGGGQSGTSVSVEFDRDALPDKNTYTIDLARIVTGSGLLARPNRTCDVYVRVGDVNGNGTVDLIDVGAVKSVNRRAVVSDPHETSGLPMFLYDVNGDGGLNIIDVALTMSRRDK